MSKLILSHNFSVDIVEYASRANAILGIRDSGKTYTATMIAEQLLDAKIPIFAFDPIGRWRFLRWPGTGKNGRGFPIVIAGGKAPDLPLTRDNAAKIVRQALKANVSVVFDLYSVNMTKADWRAIVLASIETIMFESEGHGLRHVILEEAAEFIPQHVRDGLTYSAVEKLARMGGNVGVGITLINQRAEEVNKAVLELCDNLLLHRQRGKNSLVSLAKWLDAGNVKPPKQITESLAELATGKCWAWFRDEGKPKLITVAKKLSFDPNRRELALARDVAANPLSTDVSAFVEQMKAALEGRKAIVVKNTVGVALPASSNTVSAKPKEAQVDEKEARALRAANEDLKKQVADLLRKLSALANPGAPAPAAAGESFAIDLTVQKPEISLRHVPKVIKMDTEKQSGLLAKMITEGWFDEMKDGKSVIAELKRRGRAVHPTNVLRDLNKLAEMGFLTKEAGGYQAAADMKINIEEAA